MRLKGPPRHRLLRRPGVHADCYCLCYSLGASFSEIASGQLRKSRYRSGNGDRLPGVGLLPKVWEQEGPGAPYLQRHSRKRRPARPRLHPAHESPESMVASACTLSSTVARAEGCRRPTWASPTTTSAALRLGRVLCLSLPCMPPPWWPAGGPGAQDSSEGGGHVQAAGHVQGAGDDPCRLGEAGKDCQRPRTRLSPGPRTNLTLWSRRLRSIPTHCSARRW